MEQMAHIPLTDLVYEDRHRLLSGHGGNAGKDPPRNLDFTQPSHDERNNPVRDETYN